MDCANSRWSLPLILPRPHVGDVVRYGFCNSAKFAAREFAPRIGESIAPIGIVASWTFEPAGDDRAARAPGGPIVFIGAVWKSRLRRRVTGDARRRASTIFSTEECAAINAVGCS